MKSYAYPVKAIPRLQCRVAAAKSRLIALYEDWAMLKLIGWSATIAVLGFLTWQATAAQPYWAPTISVLLLVALSLVAGLRLGADSAAAYTKDLQRLNKVLADQNRELEDANAMLLEQISKDSTTPSTSA